MSIMFLNILFSEFREQQVRALKINTWRQMKKYKLKDKLKI